MHNSKQFRMSKQQHFFGKHSPIFTTCFPEAEVHGWNSVNNSAMKVTLCTFKAVCLHDNLFCPQTLCSEQQMFAVSKFRNTLWLDYRVLMYFIHKLTWLLESFSECICVKPQTRTHSLTDVLHGILVAQRAALKDIHIWRFRAIFWTEAKVWTGRSSWLILSLVLTLYWEDLLTLLSISKVILDLWDSSGCRLLLLYPALLCCPGKSTLQSLAGLLWILAPV